MVRGARPWVVAHRGDSKNFPENTLSAFRGAAASPTDAVELDVQFSADEQLMVCHDRTLERFGLGSGRIREQTAATLQGLDMGGWFDPDFQGEVMPTLKQVFDQCASSMPLLVELKVRDEVEPRRTKFLQGFIDEWARVEEPHELFVLCFDLDVLDQLHAMEEGLPCILNVETLEDLPKDLMDMRPWLIALDVRIDLLTPEFRAKVRDAGRLCFTYTCNEESDVRRALEMQVDGIITDDPERVYDWILAEEEQ